MDLYVVETLPLLWHGPTTQVTHLSECNCPYMLLALEYVPRLYCSGFIVGYHTVLQMNENDAKSVFLMTFPLWVSCYNLKMKLHRLFETCKQIHFDSSMHTLYLFTLQFLLMFICKQSVYDTYLPEVIKQLMSI